MDLTKLKASPRFLVVASLKPVLGTRFQPTGFPDIGPARYSTSDGQDLLIVESAQSMANRLESVCWDSARNDWCAPLTGLPYVAVVNKEKVPVTTSVTEAHRINSPYILEGKDKTFFETLRKELGADEQGRVDMRKLAGTLLKYDINSLLHGVFIAKKEIAGGRMRLPRALTAFIEASDVKSAASGGVKNDSVNPSGDAKKGFGNVPFHREEFTGKISAFFNLDVSQILGYGLGEDAENLLLALALYKIRALLDKPFRPRTACDLEVQSIEVKRPDGYVLPTLNELESVLPKLIKTASKSFASPPTTTVTFE
jgi:CRISPR-associated protein Csb1